MESGRNTNVFRPLFLPEMYIFAGALDLFLCRKLLLINYTPYKYTWRALARYSWKEAGKQNVSALNCNR